MRGSALDHPEAARSRKRLAVIVLNCNGCELLRACLRSLERQDFRAFDTVVVDNGSSDGSLEMLAREFPSARVLALGSNRGFSVANNIALRDALAQGYEFIMLLNNDTVADPGCVRELVTAIERDSRIAAVCPKIYFAAQPNRLWYAGADFSLWTARLTQRGWKQEDSGQFDANRNITAATGCCLLVRASAVRDAGALDEVLWAYLEDVEWSIRFLGCGYSIRLAPRAKLWHHDGATWVGMIGRGSQRRRQYYSTRNLLLIAAKHARTFQLPGFLLGFLIWEVAFYSALRLWRRDFAAFAAIYRGSLAALWLMMRHRNAPRVSGTAEEQA